MTPIRFHDGLERPRDDEQRAIDGIIEGMTRVSETVRARAHHAVRASHAKASGCAVGTLAVPEGLPPELAQGLFATPGTHPVAVRFAQGPGEILGDRVSTHRGMAIKVFEVAGEKLPGHDADTQDFVLATGTTFPSGTAQGFLRDSRAIGAAVPLGEGFKSAVAATARGIDRVLHAIGAESPTADFLGHPFAHPLAEPYHSQAPLRFGDHVAKLGAFPVAPAQTALAGRRLDPREDPDVFRHATIAFLAGQDAVFELRAQLLTDPDTMPIEDASVDWPVEASPYRTVATLTLPAQDAWSEARRRYFDEVMTFRPAHALAAHRPLGSVMRARLQVYRALSAFRHRANGVDEENTASPDRIPA